ncbi:hypothetical protein ACPVPU_09585 [Sphingomonas sp. CJ99]
MYALYKPLRNFLRGFNLWSGLGATYFYTQHLCFNQRLPEQLKNNALKLGQSNVKAGLHGHLVELLAREMILNGQQRGGKPLSNADAAFKAMGMIHRLDDKFWGLHGSRSDDIILHLSRVAFQQFPWQTPLTNGVLARYHMLYDHPLVAPLVEAEFGMSTGELFQLILLLADEMLWRPTLAFEFLPAADKSIHAPVWALLDRISRSANDLRTATVERQSYDVNWAYSFNPLRAFPLVHAGNPGALMCPVPTILLQRLTDGLYFDFINAHSSFGNVIGKAFEHYVGKVVERIGGDVFDLREEARWGKPERRSIDWIVSDNSASLFVECKLGRLDNASQTEISPEPPFVAAIGRLAENVGQLYATLSDALAGGYPHWKPDGRPVHPVVVTFHEWFCFGPFFYKHLDELVDTEFEKRRLDRVLLKRHPYCVCSISEFEGLLAAGSEATLDVVLSEKLSAAHRLSLTQGFLADRYPGSLSRAKRAFEDGMDSVIAAPSRLTRQ